MAQRLRMDDADHNDAFAPLLPRRGVVVRICSDIHGNSDWYLLRLDEPLEYQLKAGEPSGFRLLHVSHVLVRPRWVGRAMRTPARVVPPRCAALGAPTRPATDRALPPAGTMDMFDRFEGNRGKGDRPMELRSLTLLQPEAVISARADAADIGDFANALMVVVGGSGKPTGAQGLVAAIILKPGHRMRAWCEFVPEPDHSAAAALEEALGAVAAPEVSDVIAFAMYFARGAVELPSIPRAWRQLAAREHPVRIPEGIVARLWPDAG